MDAATAPLGRNRTSRSALLAVAGGIVEVAGITDQGTHREENEDDWAFASNRGEAGEAGCLLLVADGMGGHAGGGEASRAAVAAALQVAEGKGEGGQAAGGAALLQRMVGAADAAVGEVAQTIRGSPGTTLVAALISGSRATVANVGDSRAYLVQPRGAAGSFDAATATPLTTDHTQAAEDVASGRISAEEARHSPRRNSITRALLGEGSAADILPAELAPGDVLVLCSDGLWEPLDDAALGRLLGGGDTSLEAAVERACDAALQAGSRDNVTLVAARLLAPQP